jgi:putative ABC transport system substrate-binding protein
VSNVTEVSGQLDALSREADVFWMLPDVNVITPETVEMIFLHSMNNKVPVVTFSSKYVHMGAFMSLDVDPFDMGLQAARMVGEILSGTDIDTIADESARKVNITINDRTARKLGLHVSDAILKKAGVINK